MNFHQNVRNRSTIRLAIAALGIALALATPSAIAQSPDAKPAPSGNIVKTFYLTNSNSADSNDIVSALRNELTPDSKIYLVVNQNALVVQTSPEQMQLAQKLLDEVDRPKKIYRLTFTIVESDAGKRIGTQHYALILVSGQRTSLKQGSKVPVATGSYDNGKASTQTQFTYLDVGINIDSTLDDSPNGVRLKSKVEQSSIAESTVIADVREPIIRQSVLEGTSLLTVGKPLTIGGLDITGSTRHLDIEAIVEIVK